MTDRAAASGGRSDDVAAEAATVEAVTSTFRDEWGRCLATVSRMVGDLEVAEDAVQEALATALRVWPQRGVPERPGAWITTTARNRALDRLRREARRGDKELAARHEQERSGTTSLAGPGAALDPAALHPVEDDQLRLILTCCHPSLSPEVQVGLTLRLVCGLTTAQIARAFLEPEATVAQRLTRAKRRLRNGDPDLRPPDGDEIARRLPSVLACLHLVFREGYAATGGDGPLRPDLCDEADRLTGLLARLLPDEPEVLGLRALVLLHDARRETRLGADGEVVLLADQDRSGWDHRKLAFGLGVLDRASRLRRPGPYQLQAAIAAEHGRAATWEATDWPTIVALYEALGRMAPSPVIDLNHAIAIAQVDGPEVGLQRLDRIDADKLARSHLLPATRARFLAELGRVVEAAAALDRAIELAPTTAERRLLEQRRRHLDDAD